MIDNEMVSRIVGKIVLLLILCLPVVSLSFAHPSPLSSRNNGNKSDKIPLPSHNPERTVVLAYNKPAGVVTTHAQDDELGRGNVYQDIYSMQGYVGVAKKIGAIDDKDALPVTQDLFENLTEIRSRLHAIGRLDADTTGLLLLTNDGGLVHHVTDKSAATLLEQPPVTKTYQAVIMGYHDQSSPAIQQIIQQGVDIGAKQGGWTEPPDDLTVLGHPTHKSTQVSLTIREGKNRQVRRMFHAVGSGVMQLQRTRIGSRLSTDGLAVGAWRILSDDEVREGLHWTPRVLPDAVATSRSKRNAKKDAPRPMPSRRRRRM
jgi:23S rRNA pseudouridine2605 synthase